MVFLIAFSNIYLNTLIGACSYTDGGGLVLGCLPIKILATFLPFTIVAYFVLSFVGLISSNPYGNYGILFSVVSIIFFYLRFSKYFHYPPNWIIFYFLISALISFVSGLMGLIVLRKKISMAGRLVSIVSIIISLIMVASFIYFYSLMGY